MESPCAAHPGIAAGRPALDRSGVEALPTGGSRTSCPDRMLILLLMFLTGVSIVLGLLQAWPLAIIIDCADDHAKLARGTTG